MFFNRIENSLTLIADLTVSRALEICCGASQVCQDDLLIATPLKGFVEVVIASSFKTEVIEKTVQDLTVIGKGTDSVV